MSKSKPKPKPQPHASETAQSNHSARRQRIAEAAYYKAECRGFAPGADEMDWLEAEQEIGDLELRGARPA